MYLYANPQGSCSREFMKYVVYFVSLTIFLLSTY